MRVPRPSCGWALSFLITIMWSRPLQREPPGPVESGGGQDGAGGMGDFRSKAAALGVPVLLV